jgi:two-component system OmpR family sensor kinase
MSGRLGGGMRALATLRARVTLAFAGASAAVLALVGLGVFGLFSLGVTGSIDSGLRQRQYRLEAAAKHTSSPVSLRLRSGERFLQLYSADGSLVTSSVPARGARLLGRAQVIRGDDHPYYGEVESLPGEADEEARLRVFPLHRLGLVAVIGESLEGEHELQLRLGILLALALPLALAIASYLGYRLAGAALGPVERMRARAEQITGSDLTERLPLPAAQDEIARLGHTFNELLDRLAAAFARERRIVSDASHELRTPLAVLQAELQVAARPERTPEQLREAIGSALEETHRLARLADDLLILARNDGGSLPLRLEPLDVADVLRDLARRNPAAAAGALTTAVDIPGGAVVRADPDRLAQALDNLVANAQIHGDPPIEVRARPAGDAVAFTVTDAGPGFGAAIDSAFERFTQGDHSRGGSGSGLGLAIVEAIAGAHGGHVSAEDLPAGGARVTLVLPSA